MLVGGVKSSSRASPGAKRGSERLWQQRERDAERRDMNRQAQTIAQLLTKITITSSPSLLLTPLTHTHTKPAPSRAFSESNLCAQTLQPRTKHE